MQQQDAAGGYTVESESTEAFISQLGLPSLHPLCESDSSVSWFRDDVPPIGSADLDYYHLHDDSIMEIIKTLWHMIMPPFLAFFALWLLLFAALVAPLGCLLLLKFDQNRIQSETPSAKQLCQPTKAKMTNVASTPIWLSTICSVTIASSFAVMADKLYIHDFGPQYGAGLFMISSLLSLSICNHHPFKLTRGSILVVGLLAVCISMWDPHRQPASPLTPNFEEGLYYDARNPLMKHIVSNWDPASRIYSPSNGATKWMTTGDVRTGMPFFLNKIDYNPRWKRVWLSTQTSPDEEVLALDIAFPDTGHDFSKPIYLVYHGLNGGSKEGYVQDLVMRRNQEGSTVVVMIARGMMDTPIRSWNFFHGARLSDAHDAAVAIRGALGPEQILVGVGYSMGAIILNNYVATYGSSCALDAAFSISGALDCRYELNDTRSKKLWQPLLADSVKTLSLFGKHGKKVRERLTNYEMVQLMRASSVVVSAIRFANLARVFSELHYLNKHTFAPTGGGYMGSGGISWI